MPPELVLAIGITGHRRIGMEGESATAVAGGINAILERLHAAVQMASAREPTLLHTARTRLRLVSMFAEGADLLAMEAGHRAGCELAAVLPCRLEAYRTDLTPAALIRLEALLPGAHRIELDGPPATDAAYARANEVILDRADLLVAVWDGRAARGRGGTAEVVQRAVDRGMPVIVIAPDDGVATLLADAAADLLPPIALDLPRMPLNGVLEATIDRLLRPSRRRAERRALTDLFADVPGRFRRPEHALLMALAGTVDRAGRRAIPMPDPGQERHEAIALTRALGASETGNAAVETAYRAADTLADAYGHSYRSSLVLRFPITAGFALMTGLVGIVRPEWGQATIALQGVANAVVLIDSARAARSRWRERWLQQRILAERLRCLRLLLPLGLASHLAVRHGAPSAADWIVLRLARAHEGSAKLDGTAATVAARYLIDVEVAGQIAYHRRTLRRLDRLGRRLQALALVSLIAMVAAGLFLLLLPFTDLPGRAYAALALIVGPAFASAFNGLRAETDLNRLAQRSARILPRLRTVASALIAGETTMDRVRVAAVRVAAITTAESEEWRTVWASRAAPGRLRGFSAGRVPWRR